MRDIHENFLLLLSNAINGNFDEHIVISEYFCLCLMIEVNDTIKYNLKIRKTNNDRQKGMLTNETYGDIP